MKTRSTFVSNSSSSSFVINKSMISMESQNQILEFLNSDANLDGFSCFEDKETISGYSVMDNSHFSNFLESINFPDDSIRWEHF